MNEMLEDDDTITISSYIKNVSLTGRGKNKMKEITGIIPANSFAKQEGVYDIAQCTNAVFVIGKIDLLSEESKDILKYQQDFWKDKDQLVKKSAPRKK